MSQFVKIWREVKNAHFYTYNPYFYSSGTLKMKQKCFFQDPNLGPFQQTKKGEFISGMVW